MQPPERMNAFLPIYAAHFRRWLVVLLHRAD